jgi:malonyl-CoA/methylmalonyl-CoA synthetase
MTNDNFFARLRPGVLAAGDKPFLVTPDAATLGYNDCDSISGSLANLFAKLGLVAGDRVLSRTAKSPMALMVYLACLRSGIIHVPVNPDCTPDELDYFVGDATPTLFIGDPESCFRIEEFHGIKALSLDTDGEGTLTSAAAGQPSAHTVVTSNASDVAVLIYTSGTTGTPKGAMISHGNLHANTAALYACWGWSGNDILLHCLPIFHIHGLFVATHLALLGASTMIFLPRFDSAAVLKCLPDATVFMGVPTYYTRLLQEDAFDNAACRNIRLFVSGSAPLSEDTFYAFREKTGHTILERYGMSETGMLTSNPLNGERVGGTVGYPLAGVQTRVCDEVGKLVAPGGIGILQVLGPNVFSGYWRKPELNATEFQDGYFITGDLVRVAEDGRISIVGRNKDMIISGGLNVYPREIENVLDAQSGIRESAVFGIPHPDFGEGVVAAVVPEPGVPLNTDALMAACRKHLASYKSPKRIVVLNDLPRNTMGKVQKNRLREQYADLFHNS